MTMQTTSPEGYNAAQLRMVLQSIALQMAALNGVLQMAQTRDDEWELGRLVDAAQALAQGLGCLADGAIGGEIVGDAGRWYCGTAFERAASAAAKGGAL